MIIPRDRLFILFCFISRMYALVMSHMKCLWICICILNYSYFSISLSEIARDSMMTINILSSFLFLLYSLYMLRNKRRENEK